MIRTAKISYLFFMLAFLLCSCMAPGAKPISRQFDTANQLFGGGVNKGLVVGVRKSGCSSGFVNVFLKNENKHPLTVYSSFRVDTGQFDDTSDLFITVVDNETKSEMTMTTRKNMSLISFDRNSYKYYYTLAPSEYLECCVDLTDYYNLEAGKMYSVVVEYDHQSTGFEKGGEWIEMNAWTGRTASNRLRIKMGSER